MRTRRVCLLGFGLAWCSAAVFLACGGGGSAGDGGADASVDTGDVAQRDSHLDRIGKDSPVDRGDAGPADSGLVGHCSPVNGPACDIVLQDCPSKEECVVVSDPTAESGLGFTTQCQPNTASEHLAAGATCCPGGANPCDPGLVCIGSSCAGDAGGGRCAPACCPGDAGAIQANCGFSPEGYAGSCSLTLTGGKPTAKDEAGALYTTCLYASTCTIFAQPCGPGDTCIVEDMAGTSKCVPISNDGGSVGVSPGGLCGGFANACAQGLACIGLSFDGAVLPSTCNYMCYLTGGSPPFDAGIITSAPGMGGCPSGQACKAVGGFPTWLGACGP
jgi:hypothetical protein